MYVVALVLNIVGEVLSLIPYEPLQLPLGVCRNGERIYMITVRLIFHILVWSVT